MSDNNEYGANDSSIGNGGADPEDRYSVLATNPDIGRYLCTDLGRVPRGDPEFAGVMERVRSILTSMYNQNIVDFISDKERIMNATITWLTERQKECIRQNVPSKETRNAKERQFRFFEKLGRIAFGLSGPEFEKKYSSYVHYGVDGLEDDNDSRLDGISGSNSSPSMLSNNLSDAVGVAESLMKLATPQNGLLRSTRGGTLRAMTEAMMAVAEPMMSEYPPRIGGGSQSTANKRKLHLLETGGNEADAVAENGRNNSEQRTGSEVASSETFPVRQGAAVHFLENASQQQDGQAQAVVKKMRPTVSSAHIPSVMETHIHSNGNGAMGADGNARVENLHRLIGRSGSSTGSGSGSVISTNSFNSDIRSSSSSSNGINRSSSGGGGSASSGGSGFVAANKSMVALPSQRQAFTEAMTPKVVSGADVAMFLRTSSFGSLTKHLANVVLTCAQENGWKARDIVFDVLGHVVEHERVNR